MAKWFLIRKSGDFNGIAKRFGIDPVTARLLRNRGLTDETQIEEFLHGGPESMHAPMQLGSVCRAVVLLKEEIQRGGHIRIMGDYDVDGVCASYILQRGLEVYITQKAAHQPVVDITQDHSNEPEVDITQNATCRPEVDITQTPSVSVIIPHRIKDGYGLNRRLIEEAIRDKVDLLLTCDNGISASEEISLAKQNGIRVIVTDHHEVPFEPDGDNKRYLIPEADCIVDPKLPEDPYPYKGVCGAVVAYKLMAQLFEFPSVPESEDSLQAELLGFAALATVCDVMELTGENRIIVKEGLKLLSHTPNPGMRALLEVTGLLGKQLGYYHAGFIIGPCINACGRLDSADRVLRLLNAKDDREALQLASECKALNDSRKELTEKGVKQGLEQIGEGPLDKVLVVYLPDTHESIAGIIAGKLKETCHRPAIVLTDSLEGVKGSGRSTEAYNMYEHLSACKDLMTKFGGHAGAAGLSMPKENIGELRRRLNEGCELTEEDFTEKLYIDMAMPISYASIALVKEFDLLEPCGNGNPKPMFAEKQLTLSKGTLVGKNRNVLKLTVEPGNGQRAELVLFREVDAFRAFLETKYGEGAYGKLLEGRGSFPINAAYYPQINVFRGREELEFILEDYC